MTLNFPTEMLPANDATNQPHVVICLLSVDKPRKRAHEVLYERQAIS